MLSEQILSSLCCQRGGESPLADQVLICQSTRSNFGRWRGRQLPSQVCLCGLISRNSYQNCVSSPPHLDNGVAPLSPFLLRTSTMRVWAEVIALRAIMGTRFIHSRKSYLSTTTFSILAAKPRAKTLQSFGECRHLPSNLLLPIWGLV